ncbi:unnamed protein product [Penicillium camemberti]|uniref:Str. FM013 n=1 Tax=Penicillium camemberti (strain FM 013) TaxID=1429867 RepID=A0A0G4PHX6_PENC3|nr:unnamed protein product [Penicillium camemberti]
MVERLRTDGVTIAAEVFLPILHSDLPIGRCGGTSHWRGKSRTGFYRCLETQRPQSSRSSRISPQSLMSSQAPNWQLLSPHQPGDC